jgi:hypothetical protein
VRQGRAHHQRETEDCSRCLKGTQCNLCATPARHPPGCHTQRWRARQCLGAAPDAADSRTSGGVTFQTTSRELELALRRPTITHLSTVLLGTLLAAIPFSCSILGTYDNPVNSTLISLSPLAIGMVMRPATYRSIEAGESRDSQYLRRSSRGSRNP